MYVNHTERSDANQNQNANEVSPIMPGKWKQPQSSQAQPYSSVFRELNNVHLEVNNFVDLLYVSFDNRPVPSNELFLNNGGRLELMLDADDEDPNDERSAGKSRSERLRTKRSSLRDGCSSSYASLRSNEDKLSDKNDLKNDLRGSTKLFSPTLLNGKQYKPKHGLQEPFLYSGSRFVGFQKSNAGSSNKPNCYGVEVIIQHCDLENFFICGHLKINGLTDEYPTLTTFFEGEIISKKHPFLTRKYDTDSDVDRLHWSRFGTAFIPFLNALNEENYDYSKVNRSSHVFMRWKEEFLASDHKVKKIDGACFDGFYYILFNRMTGSIEGFYFHKQAEAFQLLSLKHEDSGSKLRWNKIYEFR